MLDDVDEAHEADKGPVAAVSTTFDVEEDEHLTTNSHDVFATALELLLLLLEALSTFILVQLSKADDNALLLLGSTFSIFFIFFVSRTHSKLLYRI